MSDQIMVTGVDKVEVPLARDFGAQAQQAAEAHINQVWEYHHAVEEAEGDAEVQALGDDPAIGAFCGCTTCEVREILFASLPFLQAGFARDGEAPVEPYAVNLIQCPQDEQVECKHEWQATVVPLGTLPRVHCTKCPKTREMGEDA